MRRVALAWIHLHYIPLHLQSQSHIDPYIPIKINQIVIDPIKNGWRIQVPWSTWFREEWVTPFPFLTLRYTSTRRAYNVCRERKSTGDDLYTLKLTALLSKISSQAPPLGWPYKRADTWTLAQLTHQVFEKRIALAFSPNRFTLSTIVCQRFCHFSYWKKRRSSLPWIPFKFWCTFFSS